MQPFVEFKVIYFTEHSCPSVFVCVYVCVCVCVCACVCVLKVYVL